LREGAGPLPPHESQGLSLAVDVRNLLDVRTLSVDRNPLSDADNTSVQQALTDFAGYPLPGRTILVSLTWTEGAPQGSLP
jgi:outer membrane receptor protein involved in Fe transport